MLRRGGELAGEQLRIAVTDPLVAVERMPGPQGLDTEALNCERGAQVRSHSPEGERTSTSRWSLPLSRKAT
jgi:hypothetical protein